MNHLKSYQCEDLSQILASIIVAQMTNSGHGIEFKKGFLTALLCFGLAVGLKPREFMPPEFQAYVERSSG